MAEIQYWRRRMQHRRSVPSVQSQDQDLDKADMTLAASLLSRQASSESDYRSRPMSRLASFLAVHSLQGSVDKPEPPAFDWALPKDRDKVYKPDCEAMANTLRSRVLRYPVNNIPAQYNSFVLHLLEDYQRLLNENTHLRKALDAEIEDHEVDRSKYESMSAAWELERRRLAAPAPSNMQRESNDDLERGYDRSATFKAMKPRASDKAHQLSPSRGMARLSRQFLKQSTGSGKPPTLLLAPLGRPEKTRGFLGPVSPLPSQQSQDMVPSSDSDFSDVKGDLLPDEEDQGSPIFEKEDQAHIARLALWLDEQNLAEAQGVLPELSSSVPDRRKLDTLTSQAGTTGKTTALRKTARILATNVDGRPALARNQKSDEEVLVRKDADTSHHRRGFSFVPGDDLRNVHPYSALTTSALSKAIEVEGTTPPNVSDHSPLNPEGIISAIIQARPIATALQSIAGEPQRDNSNRSVLTAIHNGLESVSPGTIPGSYDGARKRKTPGRRASSDKKLSLATAAARAAGKT